MGKLTKLGFLIVSVFVLIFIFVGVIKGVSNIGFQSNKTKQSTSAMPGIKEYNQIRVGDAKTGKGGMSMKEVEKILGQPTSQTNGKSGNLVMDVYTYASSAGPNSIMITFINGHTSGKTQTGLK